MRHLATVQKIKSLTPIPEKDRIVLAEVLGWNVIVQKSEFQEGDLCVYVEIDSVLPEKPEFEFLRSKNFRIKTMKMAGVVSQGICFPMSFLPEGNYKEGQDVTNILGVKQYEPLMDDPVPEKSNKSPFMRFAWYRKLFAKKKSGKFPDFIAKTDEIRIQTAPWLLDDKNPHIVTEKVDGTSGTYVLLRHRFLCFSRYEFMVCSRNRRLSHPDGSIYWAVAQKYPIENALRKLIKGDKWVAIQGECIGPKVQGNKYKVKEPQFYAFNLVYPSGRTGSLCAKAWLENLDIPFVPILDSYYILPNTVQEMLEAAHGQSKLGDTLREGLVVRSEDGRKSFKAVDPQFLLKYGE